MHNWLVKKFIKDYENTGDLNVRAAYGKLSGKVGIFCNAFLFLGKFIVGTVSGSVSITADAVNNLSDAASSIISLIGFKMAEKPADADHPYGHARYEYQEQPGQGTESFSGRFQRRSGRRAHRLHSRKAVDVSF